MEDFIEIASKNYLLIFLLVFTVILGFEIISKVPTVLHTPLMSGSNAISGIVVIGAILLIRQSPSSAWLELTAGMLALALAMVNVVGGFAVTQRMLEMFKKKKSKP
ncbi:MAG: NAD(P) transhydrogenase subunit alpha [Bacteroidetes bacterium]|nr:NAD(P) transhydrogenase subunit alpha [Bacteroidota bacterium]MDA0931066.1 NAD(P) transhydrogenase subunit alpha [Bacteroidota bacterium]